MTDKIEPWSDARSDEPPQLPEYLEHKNARLLNPLVAPDLYFKLYDKAATQVSIGVVDDQNQSCAVQNYELVSNINNPETSSHFKVINNPDTGHHILIAKGMDLPLFRDEGAGHLGFVDDLAQQSDAGEGCITGQILDAEKAYLGLLQDPTVKSIEVIGYSIGSIPANYLAAVYGANVTNIADLGVPGAGQNTAPDFNACAHGLFPGVTGVFKDNLNEHVIGLKLRGDILGGLAGDVGQEYGQQIILDEGGSDIAGLAHVPQVYAGAAKDYDPNTPDVQVEHSDPQKIFQPF